MKRKDPSQFHLFSGIIPAAVMLSAASASAQNLFEVDSDSGNIYEFTPGGMQSSFVSGLDFPWSLAFDSAGDLFVGQNSNIVKIAPDGSQNIFATASSPAVRGLAFNSAGNLFVADESNNSIDEFTPQGVESIFASNLDVPRALAFDSNGDLFVANLGGKIIEITPSGNQSTFATLRSVPNAIAINSAGDLFVGGLLSIFQAITEITPDGAQINFAPNLHSGVQGLAFDSAGNLFASEEVTGGIITEFTPDGVQSTFTSGLNGPVDLAFAGLSLPVPEPSARALLAFGAIPFLIRQRYKIRTNISRRLTLLLNCCLMALRF